MPALLNAAPNRQDLDAFIHAVQEIRPLDISQGNDRALYVPNLQGPRDALTRLKGEIDRRLGDGVYLFTGQIGSGKSTELLRLKTLLEGPRCKVFYCDLEDWLNLDVPMDLASTLLALVAAWVVEVQTNVAQRTLAERMGDFLGRTRLSLDGIKLDAGVAQFKAQLSGSLKTDSGFRQRLEDAIQAHRGGFVEQVQAFVAELVADLCSQGEKCVLIADSLEKIRGYGEEAQKVYQSIEQLFVAEGRALRFPGVHMVYSVSPFLLAQNPNLPGALGQGVVVNMPSVHVFHKRSTELDDLGVRQMSEMLRLRYPSWSEIIPADFLQELIRDCGGDLRDYLRAIKVVLLEIEADSNISREELLEVVRGQISPSRLIPSEHIAWMAKLERSHEAELSEKISALLFQRYLATKHILAYLNGDEWYAVHPLLRDWVLNRPEAQATQAAGPV